ncbi:uncharacterized protein [Watersipora subatra]|uniref:uncharacterized protein n=1 Tax=Watersipora subatra TaxID=2589382 RepID=UPI00355B67B3
MKDLTNWLAACKSPITEEDQVVTHSSVVTALETQKDSPSLELVQQTLLNKEQKQREHSSVSVSCKRNSVANPDTDLSATRLQTTHQVTYWYCNKNGQVERFSRERKDAEPKEVPHQAKHAADNYPDTGESAFLAGMGSDSTGKVTQCWLIDSGATKHMTSYESLFREFTQFDKPPKVEVADGSSVNAIGIGNINVST